MIRKPILVGLLLAILATPLAVSVHRLRAADAERHRAEARLAQAGTDAERIHVLRARTERVADRKRPDQDIIARVNTVLRDVGLPEQRFNGVQQVGDEVLPGQSDRRVVYRRQSVRVSLRLTMPELGRFLAQWTASQALWTPARIELMAADGRSTAVSRSGPPTFEVTIVLTTTFLGEDDQ